MLTNNSNLKPKDFDVEKNKEWYEQYARWVGTKYNHAIPLFYNVGEVGDDTLNRPNLWASRTMKLLAYLFAEQNNGVYDYMSLDENNNPLPIKLLNTNIIYTLVKHINGTMASNIATLPDSIFARSLDSDFISYKKTLFNLSKMKIDFNYVFEKAQEQGMEFLPLGDMEFKNEEELRKYLEETVQNKMERFFTAWAKDWLYKTDYTNWVSELFRYLVPTYFNRVELYVENWNVKIKVHKPQMCIWDNSFDDENGKKQRFQGVLEEYSIPALKTAYPELTTKQLNQLDNLAKESTSQFSQVYGTNENIIWYDKNQQVVTVLKARWISLDENKESTWYQCDLIGNLFALRYKPCENMTKTAQGYLGTPFIDFIPDLINGRSRSPIDRSMDLVDRIRAYEGKIDLMVHRIKGAVTTLFADKIPEGMDAISLAQDINNGVVVLEGVLGDDYSENDKRNYAFKVEQIGIDYNSYQSLRAEVELAKNEIRDIFSIPRVALGSQKGIIGQGVQENSIAQSTFGITPLYDGFGQYLNTIIQAACEMRKNLILIAEDTDEMRETLRITKREYDIFELTKDMALVDLNVYLDNKDAITEKQRAEYMMLFEREISIPNSFVDSEVLAEAMSAQTNTEMRNILRYKKRIWEEKQAAAAKAQQEAQMQQAQMQQAAMQQMTQTQNAGKLANTQMKGDIDLEKTAMEIEADNMQPTQ